MSQPGEGFRLKTSDIRQNIESKYSCLGMFESP